MAKKKQSIPAAQCLLDQLWRLENLYYIQNKDGDKVLFKLNRAQRQFFKKKSHRNIILKARQLGFSTFLQIYMLDMALFVPGTACGLIAHTMDDAIQIFRSKVVFAYNNLPDELKQKGSGLDIEKLNATELLLMNGSSIRVGTSLRSTTLTYLHISEFGKICARFPDRAREIVTGAIPTVGQGKWIFIESTAEGQEGRFYEMVQEARALENRGEKVTSLDFKFHFFPWYEDDEYKTKAEGVVIPPEIDKYFANLSSQGIELTPEQKAWYVKQSNLLGKDIKREYPASPDEAFEAAIEGAYYGDQMAKAEKEGRVGRVPFDPLLEVETWWDLGVNDLMSVIFVQRFGSEIRIIDYYANSGEGFAHYAKELRSGHREEYRYSRHVVPHDIKVRNLGALASSRKEIAESLGIKPLEIVPNNSIQDGIEMVRNTLSRCYFDQTKAFDLVNALKNYRKKWDDKLGTWSNHHNHDWASHPADAFRTGAMAPENVSGSFDEKIRLPKFGAI